MYKRPALFLLHFSFLLILCGGLATFTTSKKGVIHLRLGQSENTFTDKKSNTPQPLPFDITLTDFQVVYYPGTQAPADYVSYIIVKDDTKEIAAQISMNKIFLQNGYRFYQSGYDKDLQGTRFMVKTDRYGLPLVYGGYVLLIISIIVFFISKNTEFRALLKHPALRKGIMIFFFLVLMNNVLPQETASHHTKSAQSCVLPQKTARQLGEIQMLYHGRICPVQTFAKAFVMELYGKQTYQSLNAEQVLSGWLLYPEKWAGEDYKMNIPLTIFPQRVGEGVVWFSSTDVLPEDLSENERLLIKGYFVLLRQYADKNDWESIELMLHKLKLYQKNKAGEILLSQGKIKAERIYNSLHIIRPIAFINLFLGIFAIIYFFRQTIEIRNRSALSLKIKTIILNVFLILSLTGIGALLCLRGYISGQVPVGGGFGTMLLLAFCIMLLALLFQQKFALFLPFGFIFSALVLFVAEMNNSQITQLQPVLVSPLLSIHVSLMMMAYSLFGFVTLIGISAFLHVLISRKCKSSSKIYDRITQMSLMSRILLYPALFLLMAGILVGSVWAEISWGNYWSWDPKETWALITLLVYALAIHPATFPLVKRPFIFHAYMLFAFLFVLMTYFGVNYLFGGMHSYK